MLTPDEDLIVRASGDPETAIRSVKERLREVNSEFVVGRDHTLTWWLDTDGWGRERFIATLFGLFATLALVLAATGLYSVVSFAVTQRTQELGIRMALGARPASVVKLVLGSTAAMLSVGVAVGLTLERDSEPRGCFVGRRKFARSSDLDRRSLHSLSCCGDCLRLAGVARRFHRSHARVARGVGRRIQNTCKTPSVGRGRLLRRSQLLQHFFAFFQNQVALFSQRSNRRHGHSIRNHALAFELAVLR